MTTTQNTNDNTRLADVIRTWEARLASKEDALRSAAQTIQGRLNSTITGLDNDRHINSLGELQSTALSFDMLCAEREQILEMLVTLRWAAQIDEA